MLKPFTYLTVFLMISGLYAQENQETSRANVIEIHVGGKVHAGPEVTYKGGRVHLALGQGGTVGYEIDKITKIVSPMPTRLRQMWGAFLGGNFNAVAGAAGEKVVEEQKFLGWGKRSAFAYGQSLIKEGKFKEAQPIFSRAFGYVRGVDDKLDNQLLTLGIAAAELANNKDANAKKGIAKVVKELEPEAKAIYYNIEGDLFMKDGDENQAILSYYKTLLLDKTNPYERAYAKSKIQAVYKKLKDPRAEQIKSLN